MLKSGVYTDKNVSLIDEDVNPDDLVDFRIWFTQLVVWGIIALIANIVKFLIQIAFPVKLVDFADFFLAPLKGHQQLEIIVVMMIVPLIINSIILWVQDAFLKGDKHAEERRLA